MSNSTIERCSARDLMIGDTVVERAPRSQSSAESRQRCVLYRRVRWKCPCLGTDTAPYSCSCAFAGLGRLPPRSPKPRPWCDTRARWLSQSPRAWRRECSTNVCGLRSVSGNHELWICTMMRWPRRKVWFTSCIVKLISSTLPGVKASGFSKLWRNFPRNGSPRTSC